MLFIAIGGFFGAVSRYAVSQYMANRISRQFPFGTFTVNIIGSFLLGYLIGLRVSNPSLFNLLGVGFMGAFTTFSTFSLEALQLAQKKHRAAMLFYILASVSAGLLFTLTGYSLSQH